MRFPCAVVIAALSVASADAAKTLNADELNNMIRSGKVDTKSLLKNAVPYKASRSLENQDGEQAEYYNGYLHGQDITGDMSITFNSCIALSVQNEVDNEILENAEEYLYDGSIRPVKSYVLFNVCSTAEDCVYGQDNENNTYLVDLATWVNAMVQYLPDNYENYCEGCQRQQNYCESQASAAAETVNFETAFFMYNDVKYQLIDCDQCYALSCFEEDNNAYEDNDFDGVAQWIYELGECTETGAQWKNLDLYAGWICNGDGTGMEIAVFVDDECTYYNSLKSYARILEDGSEVWEYYAKSTEVVSYIFNNRFDCYGGDITYINLMQEVYLEEGEYDPCYYDNSTGMVLDYDECYEMLNEIPCYTGDNAGDYQYDQGGNGANRKRHRYSRWLEENQDGDGEEGENRDDECEQFMEEYPCWTMPGESVSDEYQEACYEYQQQFKPEAADSCKSLFEDADEFGVTALSDCSYGQNQGEQAEEEAEDGDGNDNGDWDKYFQYDIYEDYAEDGAAICSYIEKIYSGQLQAVSPGYDHDSSGTMFGEDQNKGGYFPTIDTSSLRDPKKMGTAGIVFLALFVVICTFMLVFAIDRLRKCYQRNQIASMRDSRDIPFLS